MEQVLPLVYCLLPKRTKRHIPKCSMPLSEKAKECVLELKVKKFRIDFEQTVITVAQEVLESIEQIELCFFHFSQANFRKVITEGLKVRYTEDEDFGVKCRMITAPAFVPEPDVRPAFKVKL